MLPGFLIWSGVTLVFVGIGIFCFVSKTPVGFFTGVKAPAVEDVKGYNHAVGRLWLVTGLGMELLGLPLLFVPQNSPWFLLTVLGTVWLCLGLMIAYLRIEARYKKKPKGPDKEEKDGA